LTEIGKIDRWNIPPLYATSNKKSASG